MRWADALVQRGVFAGAPEPNAFTHPAGLARTDDPTRPREQEFFDEPPVWRRYIWPALAVIAGFVIGVAAYLAMRGERPRQVTARVALRRP